MCTLIVLNKVVPGLPLVLAANRDEFYEREATPAHHLGDGVWAGLDRKAGGSWMGATEAGFFAGLTNQRSANPLASAARSRGDVVMELLRAGAVQPATDALAKLAPGDFNGFNILFGDGDRLFIGYGRPDASTVEIHDVPPGIHVLPSDCLNSASFPKVERAQRAARVLLDDSRDWPGLASGLVDILADHAEPEPGDFEPLPGARLPVEIQRKLHALCIHTPTYGTRSAALIAIAPNRLAHYEFADGPPCTAPFSAVFPADR